MDQAKQQVIEAIKGHSNVLVTVSTDPSVDELSAALGLTIMLNNLDKRATSVFSGTIPPAISFLEPDKTFENSADSLRDFIIALDKEKADHLRYKVEGEAVKIFITPYKTKLSEKDLEFSQGDYNVELVIALGVTDQDHLDKALEAHGKILHDATVITVTVGNDKSTLGSLDWHDDRASSLSEMIAGLADGLKEDQPLLDQQVATALLTGIVSATDRFSNDHTTADVMKIAAQLMAAGANQQLVAAKLEEAHDIAPSVAKSAQKDKSADSGAELSIERPGKKSQEKTEESSSQEGADDIQAELEQHLAGVATSPSGTMADIEEQLKEAAKQQAAEQQPVEQQPVVPPPDSPPPSPPVPLQPPVGPDASAPPPIPVPPPASELPTASQDASMPGFEPTGPVTPPMAPPPGEAPDQSMAPPSIVMPVPPSPEPVEPPKIIQRHDAITAPPGDAPPINSIQTGPEEGQTTIDPFTGPMNRVEAPPLQPVGSEPNVGGTPEGVALLNSTDSDSTATPPAGSDAVPPPPPPLPSVPELPPLPPMPSDVSSIPLPPPPPPPVDPSGSLPPMPSGPVAGDVFGDGNAQSSSDTPPTAPEPGQFKIPGQP